MRVLLNPRGEDVMRRYPGQWVVHAIWTGSILLSWIVHASVGAEFLLTEIFTKLEVGVHGDNLKAVFSPATHRKPQPTDHHAPMELRIGINAVLGSFHSTVRDRQIVLERLGEVAQSHNGVDQPAEAR